MITTSEPKLTAIADFAKELEDTTVADIRHLIVGGVILHSEISCSAENLHSPEGNVRFFHAASDVPAVWDQFDPTKGEGQTFPR